MKSFLVFQLEDCFGIFFYKSLTRIDYLSHLWVNSIEDNYSKIIVSWGWEPKVKDEADKHGIQLWDFRDILKEIAASSEGERMYFTDDTLRTLQLFARATKV